MLPAPISAGNYVSRKSRTSQAACRPKFNTLGSSHGMSQQQTSQLATNNAEPTSTSQLQSTMSYRSQRTKLDPRVTGSSLIKELRSKNQRLGKLSSIERSLHSRERSANQFAKLLSDFQDSKQQDRQMKERYRMARIA